MDVNNALSTFTPISLSKQAKVHTACTMHTAESQRVMSRLYTTATIAYSELQL